MNKTLLLIAFITQGCATAIQEPPHTQWTETDVEDAPRNRASETTGANAAKVAAGALEGWLQAQKQPRVITCENFGYTVVCREGY